MPSFGRRSKEHLNQCHQDLQKIANELIKYFDVSVTDSHRGKELQDKYYRDGASKVKWPKSKHNSVPSKAIHLDPYPINYNNIRRYYFMAGFVMMIAHMLDIKIRWGGDWDSDTEITDQSFNDLAHFELLE